MYSEGYRAHSLGHHSTAFEFLREALGAEIASLADYFDDSRRKRNRADYVGTGSISLTEAEELLNEARAFADLARTWIAEHHPEFK